MVTSYVGWPQNVAVAFQFSSVMPSSTSVIKVGNTALTKSHNEY